MIYLMKTIENKWSLYRHTSPSGKVYIGITSRNPYYRWNNGRGYLNCLNSPFKYAIIKYGWDNIKHEILFTKLEEERAKTLEINLIRHYKNLGISYNVTDGGEGCKGIIPWNKGIKVPYEKSNKLKGTHLSEEHKLKLSISHKGKSSRGKGWKLSDKQKEILLLTHLGKSRSPEEKLKISLNSSFNKKVIELDNIGNIIHIYRSATQAANKYNIDPSWVAKACRNKTLCSKHIFTYEIPNVDYKNIYFYKNRKSTKFDFYDL